MHLAQGSTWGGTLGRNPGEVAVELRVAFLLRRGTPGLFPNAIWGRWGSGCMARSQRWGRPARPAHSSASHLKSLRPRIVRRDAARPLTMARGTRSKRASSRSGDCCNPARSEMPCRRFPTATGARPCPDRGEAERGEQSPAAVTSSTALSLRFAAAGATRSRPPCLLAGKRFLRSAGTNTTGHCIPLAWWIVMIRTASGFRTGCPASLRGKRPQRDTGGSPRKNHTSRPVSNDSGSLEVRDELAELAEVVEDHLAPPIRDALLAHASVSRKVEEEALDRIESPALLIGFRE